MAKNIDQTIRELLAVDGMNMSMDMTGVRSQNKEMLMEKRRQQPYTTRPIPINKRVIEREQVVKDNYWQVFPE